MVAVNEAIIDNLQVKLEQQNSNAGAEDMNVNDVQEQSSSHWGSDSENAPTRSEPVSNCERTRLTFTFSSGPLGVSVRNDECFDNNLIISRVYGQSLSLGLQEGDEIVALGNEDCCKMSHDVFKDVVVGKTRPLQMTILRQQVPVEHDVLSDVPLRGTG